jgi:hypothetical protein
MLPLHIEFYFFKYTKISIFGGVSKFLNLIVSEKILVNFGRFGQFWPDLGRFCYIGSGCQVDSMPKVWLKSLKPHNF